MNNRLYFSIVGAFIVLSLAATWLIAKHITIAATMLIVGGLCGIMASIPVSLALVGALIYLRDCNRAAYLESESAFETTLPVHVAKRDSLTPISTKAAPGAPLQLTKPISKARD